MSLRNGVLVAAVAALPLAGARAQVVRGIITDAGGRPVPGVVVLLLDSAAQTGGRAMSDARGGFRVAASRPGTYRVKTLRIGFRPVTSEPITLPLGSEVTRTLVVTGLPITLDTVRVADRNICRAFADSGAATFAVWEQVRTALVAAQITNASRAVQATTLSYERTLDPRAGRNGGRVLHQQSAVATQYATRPWRALPADSLRRVGYIVRERDNSLVYYAPDLDVLLSPVFVEDHCFRLTSDSKHPGLVGIAFEPTPERKNVVEIKGTIWVDRATSELKSSEFSYANARREQEELAGATVDFAKLRDGSWAVSRWDIRMPVYQQTVGAGREAQPRLAEIQVAGGELVLAQRGTDTLWASAPRVLRGTVRDSASGEAVAGARVMLSGTGLETTSDARGRFVLSGVLPGQYAVEVRTASLDSLDAMHQSPISFTTESEPVELRVPTGAQMTQALCGDAGQRAGTGIIVGSLRVRSDSTTTALRAARVAAEWITGTDSTRARRLEVRATSDGLFRLCGVPTSAAIQLRATSDSAESVDPGVVTFPLDRRVARTELLLERRDVLERLGSTFRGAVLTDSTRRPIPNAEVTIADLAKTTFTDSSGQFSVGGIPAGEHRVTVRRLGYGAADAQLVFDGRQAVERRVFLGRSVMLEPVEVRATAFDRVMASFEENRKLGLGHFMDRAELSKYDGMKMAGVLEQLPGVALIPGFTGAAYITSKHAPIPLCSDLQVVECLKNHGVYVPEKWEKQRGITAACYSLVFLDGVLMNGSKQPTEPFDVNSIAPERIEAVEYYAGPAQTPLKYSRMGSACGVLVIWTRR